MTKQTRIYNGEYTASSINGVGNIGQLHAKQSNRGNFTYPIKKIQNELKTSM